MTKVPVFRPLLPTAKMILPYLERIDQGRWYSNHGPLVKSFERRVAVHFGVPEEHVVTCTNGTIALSLALTAMGVRTGSYCAMPSWTFVATPASAIAAGLKPLFLDVERGSWAITPDTVKGALSKYDIGAVIPVAPFGAPLDLRPWKSFQDETGIPVVVDAAAAFDAFGCANYGRTVECPMMVSFHATKSMAMGEGSAIVMTEASLATEFRKLCNFGFHGMRLALKPGINAKISEYSAAVGLASFDEWVQRRAEWIELTEMFVDQVMARNNINLTPQMGGGWVSVYGNIELPEGCDVARVSQKLDRAGVETRSWWGAGCHSHPAYAACAKEAVDVTAYLGRHVIGLPFWLGLDRLSVSRVLDLLSNAIDAPPVD